MRALFAGAFCAGLQLACVCVQVRRYVSKKKKQHLALRFYVNYCGCEDKAVILQRVRNIIYFFVSSEKCFNRNSRL